MGRRPASPCWTDYRIDRRLSDYQPYWAARAGLLNRIGKAEAAEEAYDRAIGLEADPAVQRFLQQRRNGLLKRRGSSDSAG
jgi:RNA polymerase sigma-70 factor, ECF subfamily